MKKRLFLLSINDNFNIMIKDIKTLYPSVIWSIFDDLCKIPRPSKHETEVAHYVMEFGKKLNLSCEQDKVGNVIIRKPAKPGMEGCKTVVLQSHLDMVPQKNQGINHDFLKDPIVAYIDGEWVKAKDTTLGADNGIGASVALAVLQSEDIKHGPIEALFTVDEETGMTGASSLQKGFVKGDVLLNLDSEDDNEMTIGCAGGMNTTGKIKFRGEKITGKNIAYNIAITGLKGGHSGIDINLGRANSIKIITRFLWESEKRFGIRIANLEGGTLRNAIPREASASVLLTTEHKNSFEDFVEKFRQTIKTEYKKTEPGFKLEINTVEVPSGVMPMHTQKQLLNVLYAIPYGVIKLMEDMPDVVETSNNLAAVKMVNNEVTVLNLVRSALDSLKVDAGNMIESVFSLVNAETKHEGSYPGWQPDVNSPILNLTKGVYNGLFKTYPEVKVVHAGLECGIIGNIYEGMDMISFGPTIVHPHSPDEKVNIPSVKKFWELLSRVLEKIDDL